MALIGAEISVVSSCEELSFPWQRHQEITQRLDRRARETGVRVLGTGVNPGFVMDLLPLMLATVSRQVQSVRVTRVVDTSTRRVQLQRKTGAGLSVKGFEEGARGGAIGHVGLRESVFMIADTLGLKKLDEVTETLEPVVTRTRMRTEYFSIERGYVAGLKQTARALVDDREVVRLDLEMSMGAANPRDVIEIEGTPPVRVEIPGGIAGDVATASIIANCVPFVAHSRMVGVLTMRDLPVVPYFRPQTRRRDNHE
jgi:4-hydroxy-tetrahydrodipicolinate reductase